MYKMYKTRFASNNRRRKKRYVIRDERTSYLIGGEGREFEFSNCREGFVRSILLGN